VHKNRVSSSVVFKFMDVIYHCKELLFGDSVVKLSFENIFADLINCICFIYILFP
jgi:hypothetical protein